MALRLLTSLYQTLQSAERGSTIVPRPGRGNLRQLGRTNTNNLRSQKSGALLKLVLNLSVESYLPVPVKRA